jgi:hypothetical protein
MDQGTSTRDATTAQIAALATKQTVGLGNVDNTSDANKPVSTAQAAAIASAVSAHEAAPDPHPGYLTPAEGNAAYEPAGAAASAVAAHVAAADPHPGYLTPAEGNAAYEPQGAAASAVAAHVAAADPHTQYVQPGDSPSFAGLTVTGLDPVVIPHIHGDLAGSVYIHVKNVSGGQLVKGTPVRVTGAVGDTTTLEVAAAQSSSAGTMPAIGLLAETLAQNASGHAVVAGELVGLSTTAYSIGDPLYVAAGGGLTATAPTTGLVQQVAIVGRVHGSTGSVTVTIGSEMEPPVGLVTSTTAGLVPSAGTPGADRLFFWDHSAEACSYATIGPGVVMDGTTLRAEDSPWMALGDETTAATAEVKLTVRHWPHAHRLTAIPLWESSAPVGSALQLDIRVGGTSIFSTLPTIAVSGTSSTTTTAAVFSTAFVSGGQTIPAGSTVTFHVTQAPSGGGGAGLKVQMPAVRV